MRNTFFFLLSACFFVLTSCESTLDTSIEQEAEVRKAVQTPCVSSSENCAQDLINCMLRGSANPDPIGQDCIGGTTQINPRFTCGLPPSRLCECHDLETQMQIIREAVAAFQATQSPCELTHAFSVTFYTLNANGSITVHYQCCPSVIDVGPPKG